MYSQIFTDHVLSAISPKVPNFVLLSHFLDQYLIVSLILQFMISIRSFYVDAPESFRNSSQTYGDMGLWNMDEGFF